MPRAEKRVDLLRRGITRRPGPAVRPERGRLLNDPDYNFHYQKAYNLKTPILVSAGDKVQVTCT